MNTLYEQYTLAFYNVENLFHPSRDRRILDSDFTPHGLNKWTFARYHKKIDAIAKTITEIGRVETQIAPVIVGLAEIENEAVLQDLVKSLHKLGEEYAYIHHSSPDERGIDVALLYKAEFFTPLHTETLSLDLIDDLGVQDRTRDILFVKGVLSASSAGQLGKLIHLYVNHWPSRRAGTEATESKRKVAAQTLLNHIIDNDPEKLRHSSDCGDEMNIVILGDFNDEPSSPSLQNVLVADGFTNLAASLNKYYIGTVCHKGRWLLFDQIIVSGSLVNNCPGKFYIQSQTIHNDVMLRYWSGKFKGQPWRTYEGTKYVGGSSDHFPVYGVILRN